MSIFRWSGLVTLLLCTISIAGPLDQKQIGPVRTTKAEILNTASAVNPSMDVRDDGYNDRSTLDEEIVWSEGFENTVTGFLPSGWSVVDEDNGFCQQWNRQSVFQVFDYGQQNAHTGTRCAIVHYNDNAVGNSDWFIAPVVTAGGPLTLLYWAASQDPSYLESWEVRVSTTGRNIGDFTNVVETVTDAPPLWLRHTVDLSAFAGQSIYIAWKYNAADRYVMKLDDIDIVAGSNGPTGVITGVIRFDRGVGNPPRVLGDATVTVAESGIQAHSRADGSYTFRYMAEGTYTLNVTHPNYVFGAIPGVTVSSGVTIDSVDALLLPARRDSISVRFLQAPPTYILDFDTARVTFNVTNNVAVYDIDLHVFLDHTWIGDLDIWLRSPGGENVQLMRNNINLSGDSLVRTIFDDQSDRLLSEGQPPFTGRFRPYQAIENFRGDPAQGNWTLSVYDGVADDFGVMRNCTLWVKFNTAAPLAIDDPAEIPNKFSFAGNFPNPFNPSTTFEFSLDHAANVDLTIFNLLGEEVATVVRGNLTAGTHRVQFDGANLSGGIYFAKLSTPEQSITRKIVLLK